MQCSPSLPPRQTPIGFVCFAGEACPWDREAVRALVYILTGGDDEPTDFAQLFQFAEAETSSDWACVAEDIVSVAGRIADERNDSEARAVMCRLGEILGPHERGNTCPGCKTFVGSYGLLQVHLEKSPACRAWAVLRDSIHRTRFAICPACRMALAEKDMVWQHMWGFVHRDCADACETMAAGARMDAPELARVADVARGCEPKSGNDDDATSELDDAGRDCAAATAMLDKMIEGLDKEANR